MARATHLTISTADRIRLDGRGGDEGEDGENEVRQEVQVSVTYALEPGDTNLVLIADRKALEVTLAHEAAWNRIGAFRTGAFRGNGGSGGTSGRCPDPRAADEEREADEDREDEIEDPDDGSEDDPLAGLPRCGNDPLGGGPAPAGAARPYPVPMTDRETRNGGGRPVPGPNRAPAPAPDAEAMTGPQKILIRSRARKIGLTPYALDSLVFQQFKVWKVERLTKDQAASLLAALERDLKEKDGKDTKQEKDGEEGVPHADRNGRAATA